MFFEHLIQRLKCIGDSRISYELIRLFSPVWSRFRTCAHSSSGLVIKTSSSALAKTGSAIFHYTVKGKKGRIAAGTDMPALVGTVTNAMFNVFVFTVDEAGNKYVQMGTEAATEAAVRWPTLDAERCLIGYLVINPTGTGNFVGGTTALDDVTVAPNTAYVSPVGMWDTTAAID